MADDTTFEAVYLGRIGVGEKGARLHMWRRVDGEHVPGGNGSAKGFGFKSIKGRAPGAIYELTHKGDGGYVVGAFVRLIDDGTLGEIRATSDAIEVTEKLKRAEERAARDSADSIGNLTLNELREMAHRKGIDRTVLIARVVTYMTHWRTP